MASKVDVSKVLDKVSKGSKTTKAELQAVAAAADALRDQFVTEAFTDEAEDIDVDNLEDCRSKLLTLLFPIPEEPETSEEFEAVALTASMLRDEFLRFAFSEIKTLPPHSEAFARFKACLSGMTEILMKHGFVTVSEAQLLWLNIQQVEA